MDYITKIKLNNMRRNPNIYLSREKFLRLIGKKLAYPVRTLGRYL